MMWRLFCVWLSAVWIATGTLEAQKPYTIVQIGLQEAKDHFNAHNALFIDARDANMYAKGTILRALNVPMKRFKRMQKWFPIRKDAPLLIFCNGIGCDTSAQLAKKFARAGYTRLMVYRNGFPEWKRHRLPIMASPKPCRSGNTPYRPAGKPVIVSGATLYLAPDDPSRIDARWVAPLIQAGTLTKKIHLIDVRPPKQYAGGHLKGAVNIPYDPVHQTIDTARVPSDGVMLLYCNHGATSADAYVALPDAIAARTKVIEADLICDTTGCRVAPN